MLHKGIYTAMITPMKEDGYVDYTAFEHLLNWQKESGVHGVVIAGTTGEGVTLSHEEKEKLFKISSEMREDTFRIIANIGTNDTRASIELAEIAQNIGVDALMAVVPYYNKPNDNGIYAHFSMIASSSALPLMLYDVPRRTITTLTVPVVSELSDNYTNIVAVKDASNDFMKLLSYKNKLSRSLMVFSGDDNAFLANLAYGGDGIVSVTSNVVPSLIVELYNAWESGDRSTVLDGVNYLFDLNTALFQISNPISVKYAVHCLFSNISPTLRLPLMGLDETEQLKLREIVDHYVVK